MVECISGRVQRQKDPRIYGSKGADLGPGSAAETGVTAPKDISDETAIVDELMTTVLRQAPCRQTGDYLHHAIACCVDSQP